MQWTINCDLGEGMDTDKDLMPFLDLCNIACGGHAGNQETMLETLKLAKAFSVLPGAHPSYPDKANFGRKSMYIDPDLLKATIKDQIGILLEKSHQIDVPLFHVKPHGALYNDSVKNEHVAMCIVEVMKKHPTLSLVVPHESLIAKKAEEAGISLIFEGFADRRYHADGSLVARAHPDAVIYSEETALAQVKSILTSSTTATIEGIEIPLTASTFCIHGDNPQAIRLAATLKKYRDG